MSHELATTSNALHKWEDKFDRVYRWYRDETGTVTLPAELDRQRTQWAWIFALLESGRHARDSQLIAAIQKEYPGTQTRVARRLLDDTRRFYAVLDTPNLAWERVMLIQQLKEDLRKARKKGDYKSVGVLSRLYALVIGADKPIEPVENKTIINILNYNPSQLGAEQIDEEKLNKLIKTMLADDKKRQQDDFDLFLDVTDEPAS